jgi:8-oxo-dGTP pyrophosphatase MutT (NUDIX family)
MPIDLRSVRTALDGRRHREAVLSGDERFAAVAAVLREGHAGEVEILLIRRTEKPEDPWSGHMAFPGGRRDPTDEDLLATAIREAREETGLELGHENLVGRLDDLQAISRGRHISMIIAPFVFALSSFPELSPCRDEVDEIFWVPVTPMLRGETAATYEYTYGHGRLSLPAFRVQERLVWGLTHRMLIGLFDVIDGGDRAASSPY